MGKSEKLILNESLLLTPSYGPISFSRETTFYNVVCLPAAMLQSVLSLFLLPLPPKPFAIITWRRITLSWPHTLPGTWQMYQINMLILVNEFTFIKVTQLSILDWLVFCSVWVIHCVSSFVLGVSKKTKILRSLDWGWLGLVSLLDFIRNIRLF